MKNRYIVKRGDVSWCVFDNQTGEAIEWLKGRDPARRKAAIYNKNEQQVRDDQQQSKEETI